MSKSKKYSSRGSFKKRFLITGGSGFLGINLVRFLLKRGGRVTSLDIAEFDYPDVEGQLEVVQGDVRDEKLVRQALKGVDVVVHCAAALPLYAKNEIYSTNVEGTRNILQSAYEQGVERVIHVSSTAVYGIPDHHPIMEDDPLKGVGAYGETKVLAERICEEYREKGMCVPIVRPKSFVGPERLGIFALLYEWAMNGKNFPILGSGNNRYQLLDVEDCVEAIYRLTKKDCKIANDTFNIAAQEFTTIKEDFQAVLDHAGFGKRIVSLPVAPIVYLLRSFELIGISPLYQWIYETVAKDSYVSTDKAQRLIGYKSKYSNKQALIRSYQWYLDHYATFKTQTGVSHRVPWKQGVLKLAKFFF